MRTFTFLCMLALVYNLTGQPHQVSQELVASAASISNGTNTIDFAVGNSLVGEVSGASHIIRYGLLNQFKLEVVLSADELTPAITLQVYPNPVVNDLVIESAETITDGVDILLVDIQGRVLSSERITNSFRKQHIDMSAYPDGVYMLRIAKSALTNTYRIIKSH